MFKKRFNFGVVICILTIMFATTVAAYGAEQNVKQYYYADFLNSIGLFKGNNNGYELDKTPNRSEALVMLIRMMGKEKKALSKNYKHPFTDSGWADKYIGYAYTEKIANGISKNTFGGNDIATQKQYCTFILRALGYSDSKGDFDYDNADSFAANILKLDKNETDSFTRGEMAYISYKALYAKVKNTNITLANKLMSDNVISKDDFEKAEEKIKHHTSPKSSVTIMVYMVASDLESLQGRATNDLNEMMVTSTTPNVNTYILSGGTAHWRNNIMQDGKTQMFKLDNKKLSIVEELGDKQITNPNTLTDFVKKSAALSPADRYILIFWDHGKGTMGGFGKDELNQNASMSIANIKTALENSKVKFDIIGFDACLMATAETAFALNNVCSFMVASEEMTPACGWYYTTWLDTVSSNPSIDTLTLSKLMVDSAIVHASVETNADSVMSVVDVEKANDIYIKLKNSLNKGKTGELIKRANETKVLGEREGGYDQFDIVDFFNTDDVEETGGLTATVRKAVVYNRLSAPFMQACGLGFYYPKTHIEKYKDVKTMLLSMGYEEKYFEIYNKLIATPK